MSTELPLIKIVGISASGKSTLVQGLRAAGYHARPVSQEHSYVADMWQRIRPPALLIYLDADLAAQRQRRPDVTWDQSYLDQEIQRVAHALAHADLIIDTRGLSAEAVLAQALTFLTGVGVPHGAQALPPLTSTGGPLPRYPTPPDAEPNQP